MPLSQKQSYMIDYIYSLPEGQRAELIDGQIYAMAPPNFRHQKLVHQFDKLIGNYINLHSGACEVIPAPFAVFKGLFDHVHKNSTLQSKKIRPGI